MTTEQTPAEEKPQQLRIGPVGQCQKAVVLIARGSIDPRLRHAIQWAPCCQAEGG